MEFLSTQSKCVVEGGKVSSANGFNSMKVKTKSVT